MHYQLLYTHPSLFLLPGSSLDSSQPPSVYTPSSSPHNVYFSTTQRLPSIKSGIAGLDNSWKLDFPRCLQTVWIHLLKLLDQTKNRFSGVLSRLLSSASCGHNQEPRYQTSFCSWMLMALYRAGGGLILR